MAPLPTIGNVARCSLEWSLVSGIKPVNVLHLITDSEDEDEIATELGSALAANPDCFRLLMENYALNTITVTLLDGHSAGVPVNVAGAGITGGGGGNIMPAVCAVLSLHTNQRGPRGRGRLYIGPMGETDQDAGIVTEAGRVDTVNAWTALESDLLASSIQASIGVASYVHSEVNGVTTLSMRQTCGTQRRRQNQLL